MKRSIKIGIVSLVLAGGALTAGCGDLNTGSLGGGKSPEVTLPSSLPSIDLPGGNGENAAGGDSSSNSGNSNAGGSDSGGSNSGGSDSGNSNSGNSNSGGSGSGSSDSSSSAPSNSPGRFFLALAVVGVLGFILYALGRNDGRYQEGARRREDYVPQPQPGAYPPDGTRPVAGDPARRPAPSSGRPPARRPQQPRPQQPRPQVSRDFQGRTTPPPRRQASGGNAGNTRPRTQRPRDRF